MEVTNISKENFEKEVQNSDIPVMIDFWASWCGPCKMMSPIIDEIAKEHPEIKVCKVNIDKEQELAMQFEVMSIPTIIVVKNGTVVASSVGVVAKDKLLNMIK